jgi:hypothetical protein
MNSDITISMNSDMELTHNKNDYMDDTEMTIREQFTAQLDAKGNSLFAGIEKTKVTGSMAYYSMNKRKSRLTIFSSIATTSYVT